MKRVILCFSIIAVLLGSSILMLINIKESNIILTEKINQAVDYKKKSKTDEALKTVEEIQSIWDKYYTTMSFIITSDKMTSVSSSVSKLRPLLLLDNDEFYSECESIKFSIKLIYDSEFPHLHSII